MSRGRLQTHFTSRTLHELAYYSSVLAALDLDHSSRSWAEEVGENFHKGAVLWSRKQTGSDLAGEDLRREVRPPLSITKKEVMYLPTALRGHG
jgi:hypothetical protein